jgi:DNA-binding HxlR family transcriptional regulator
MEEGIPHDPGLLVPAVPLKNCPIATTLGVLGHKWTLLLIRDMSMRGATRFSEFLKLNPGITPRILSMRLRELERSGMVSRAEETTKGPRLVRWSLTEQGWDTLPILMRFAAFGAKWYAASVFEDQVPRRLREVYPLWEAQSISKRYP